MSDLTLSLRPPDRIAGPRAGTNFPALSAMSKAHILVVEDEEDIRELIRISLARDGYRVTCVESGEQALADLGRVQPDLVLLDLMLPGIDGMDVCRHLKHIPEMGRLPIIMLTAKSEEADIVAGLECGADDYVVKPFSPRVLQARVKTALRNARRAPADETAVLRFGKLTIHPLKHEAHLGTNRLDLTVTQFRILLTLAKRPGWVFSREQIVDASRGGNVTVTPRTVDVHMVHLRNKLEEYGLFIESVRGMGYRFRPPGADNVLD
jgi:two-component system, OmpR family, alkaline phosphatase synthesis response regulator PhoP